MQTVIRVEKLSKTFHHNKALHAVDLTVQQGDMVALLGCWGRLVQVNPPFFVT